jgi:hypothetical protein
MAHGDGFFENPSDSTGSKVEEEPIRRDFPGKSAVSPLAPELYDIHFTADKETVDALKLLQELLSHQVPSGDPAIIIKDSLLIRLKQVQRQRFGKGKRPKKSSDATRRAGSSGLAQEASVKGEQSRYIPTEVKSAVWERDQGHCAFVARNGRRCSERRWIEFHHIIPFAWRGESTVDNIELRCRTHNAYEGELIFGKVISKKKWALRAATGFKTSSSFPRGGRQDSGADRPGVE